MRPSLSLYFHNYVAPVVVLLGAVTPFQTYAAPLQFPQLGADLAAIAPHANPAVIALATQALACANRSQLVRNPQTLSVIDYSRPSTQPRLWVFDLAQRRLLFEELVAHGRNTGDNMATRFSNAAGSLMSSIGVFVTSNTYIGHNGYSLRLRGLEPGFNDNALDRDIVIHGASYVNSELARTQGRIGRSFGCPALRPTIAQALINAIRDGSLVVAYYPDKSWLNSSPFIHDCAITGASGTFITSIASIGKSAQRSP